MAADARPARRDHAALADEIVGRIAAELAARAEPDRSGAMAAYMRDQFPFLGVMSPGQKDAWRAAMAGLPRRLPEPVVVDAVTALWDRPEREHHYLGSTLVGRHAGSGTATPSFVGTLEVLITTKPWWDTVDALSIHAVGGLVRRHPALRSTMDTWVTGDDLWLIRSALLHMNRWKGDTDQAWLFDACLAQAAHADFFVRKAIGWALREHSKVDEQAVVAFVAAHESEFSGLSRREALMWLTRRRRRLGP
jgi:3-methyladenine DNA glycosylase AlkD